MPSGVVSTAVTTSAAVVAQGSASGIPGATKSAIYFGFTLRETAGATAVCRIRTGGASGKILDTISLAANESTADDYLPQGLMAEDGIYFEKVSGTVEGSVRHG